MEAQRFVPQTLPDWVRSLAAGVPDAPEDESPLPQAPPGTLFALAADGGWAVPPRPFELLFGRDAANVNIPVGFNDKRISRVHGRLVCHGREWTIRNEGRMPILFPGDSMLLQGQERLVENAYTPVFIGDLGRRMHSLEIRVIGGRRDDPFSGSDDDTTTMPATHPLSETERLVLTVLAQRYLLGESHAQPVAWKQVAADLNAREGEDRVWDEKSAARVVEGVRKRLSKPDYHHRVPGLLRDEVFAEPLGNALNDNLIRALLQSATLTPADLRRFGELHALSEPDDHRSREQMIQ